MPNFRKIAAFLGVFALFLGVFSSFASPDTYQYKSAITWHDDGTGTATSLIEAGEVVKTDGKVTSITASWKFEGQVRLEVSVNGGKSYISVINGVPLDLEGQGARGQGQEIKWRARLGSDSRLNEVKITYTDSLGMKGSFGEPALTGFKYRKPIHIKNPSGQELFNYQVNVKVASAKGAGSFDVHCEGKGKPDFTDIRFTAADGQTLLPYYREKAADGASAKAASFWVKVWQLSRGNNKIYIYYGNAGAEDLSDGEEVFEFFDDFRETTLNLDKWEVHPYEKGSYSIESGQLKLDSAKVLSKNYQIKDGIIECQAKAVSGYENRVIVREDKSAGLSQAVFSSADKDFQHCIAVGNKAVANDAEPITAGIKYRYRVTASGQNLFFERYEGDCGEFCFSLDNRQALVSYDNKGGITKGHVGIEVGAGSLSRYDWVRTRKYVESEPTVDISQVAGEERVKPATFTNMTINENGKLVLKDSFKEGSYVSQGFDSSFPVRVMIPRWEDVSSSGGTVSVDISADKGVTYKTDCERGEFYYASLEDFSMGSELMFRVGMKRVKETSASPQVESVELDVRRGKILIITPNGGEQWVPGAEEDIMWSASNYERDYKMNLEYSLDSGQTYEILAENVPNSGEFLWRIPEDISLTDEGKIRISDANCKERCEDIVDQSDKVFRLGDSIEEKVDENTRSWDDLEAETETGFDETSEVVIEDAVTIVTEGDIKFKKLILGDGVGENKTRLVLNHNIDSASGDIVIRKGGELVQTNKKTQEISGDLIIEEGGVLTHQANEDKERYQINITARNIILEKGGLITAKGKGYAGGEVREAGRGVSGGRYVDDVKLACGGSHGGIGGGVRKYRLDEAEEVVYGKKRDPRKSGSGGAGSWEVPGGAGGGIIHLNAINEFSISGIITADGVGGSISEDNDYDSAGGAGGSIYLRAVTFSGKGARIIAYGGSGHTSGGGGAGGRIYIESPAGVIRGGVNANGGLGVEEGMAGSVIIK
jgi:hypothetical protein